MKKLLMIGRVLALCILTVPVAADISGIDPNHGPTTGGTPVMIYRSGNFSGGVPYTANFDGDWVDCVYVNPSTLTATTPPHATGSGSVYFYNGMGFSRGPFSLTFEEGGSPVPEFPTMLFPVTMIIGFLGAVLLIQRTREL